MKQDMSLNWMHREEMVGGNFPETLKVLPVSCTRKRLPFTALKFGGNNVLLQIKVVPRDIVL